MVSMIYVNRIGLDTVEENLNLDGRGTNRIAKAKIIVDNRARVENLASSKFSTSDLKRRNSSHKVPNALAVEIP